MSSNSIFISVVSTPEVNNSDLTFVIETIDASTNYLFTIMVTGLVSSDSEIDVADKISTQFNTYLASYLYNGTPKLTGEDFEAQFRIVRSDHIVSVWSQCQYTLILAGNTSGVSLKAEGYPILSTIEGAQDTASIKGNCFTLPNGSAMTNNQVMNLLYISSVELCNYLRTKVAVTTYLNSFRGNDTKSVFTRPTPGVSLDNVAVKPKNYFYYFLSSLPIFTYLSTSFNWKRNTSGELNYRPDSTVVERHGPFNLDNEVQITFQSGYYQIPEELTWALIDLISIQTSDTLGVRRLSGGSGSVEFEPSGIRYSRIFNSVKSYKSK